MQFDIRFLQHHQIDKARWNRTLFGSSNARVYANAWFLDAMCNGWNAFVTPDYKYIMPLPVRSKYGLQYIFHPAFTQQLGIFSTEEITPLIISLFLQKLRMKYKWINYPFNSKNICPENSVSRKNYLLALTDYDGLTKGYNRNVQRNIRKAKQENVYVIENIDPSDCIAIHKHRFSGSDDDYSNLLMAFEAARLRQQLYTFGAYRNNNLLASSVYLLFKNRLVFIMNGNTNESFDYGATHLLKDHVIQKFSNKNIIINFEGSDNADFARFYQQFGANTIETYSVMTASNIPFLGSTANAIIANNFLRLRGRSVL